MPTPPLERPNNFEYVRHLVNPLSGQLCYRETDLVVKGAQNIILERIYLSPSFQVQYSPNKVTDLLLRQKHLSRGSKGWTLLPHLLLKRVNQRWLVVDENGAFLSFLEKKGEFAIEEPNSGMHNWGGSNPGGCFDPRNIRLEKGKTTITVHFPSGLTRIYSLSKPTLYLLQKEIFPNGKILRYFYRDKMGKLERIEACDPEERYVYAELKADIRDCKEEYSGSNEVNAVYQFERKMAYAKEKRRSGSSNATLALPRSLKKINSPLQGDMEFVYSDKLLVEEGCRSNNPFRCFYKKVSHEGRGNFYQLERLAFSNGEERFDYCPPILGKKDGSTTVFHADGVKTAYAYNKDLLLTKEELFDEGGACRKRTVYTWNDNNFIASIEIQDGNGTVFHKRSFLYDKFGNPIREEIEGGSVIFREYSQEGRNLLLSETQGRRERVFTYVPGTNLLESRVIKENGAVRLRESWIYDDCLNLIEEREEDGTVSKIKRYALRQAPPFLHLPEKIFYLYRESEEEILLKSSKLGYDQFGNICREEVFDGQGNYIYSIAKEFNERGELLLETNALGQTASYTYDEKGNCIEETGFSGTHRRFSYDSSGNIVSETIIPLKGAPRTISYAYDASNRLAKKTDFNGTVTEIAYDPLSSMPNRSFTVAAEKEYCTKAEYDLLGFTVSLTDERGFKTQCVRNIYGKPLSVRFPDGAEERFFYDPEGFLISEENPEGIVIKYARDIWGRPVHKAVYSPSNELLAEEYFTYSARCLLSHVDREGYETKYYYDGAGRKVCEEKMGRKVFFSYDFLDRIITTEQAGQTVHYKYDPIGNLLEEKVLNQAGDIQKKVLYEYDSEGNCISARHGENGIFKKEYDGYGRLIFEEDPAGAATVYTFDDEARSCIKADPAGIKTVISFDPFQRPVAIERFDKEGARFSGERREYDPSGNLERVVQLDYKTGVLQSEREITFTYTPRGRLSSETRGGEKTTCYFYSPAGNLAEKSLPGGVSIEFCYSSLGYLISRRSSDGSIFDTYKYNRLGHVTEACNQLTGHKVFREYDPFGNMTKENTTDCLFLEKSYDGLDRPLFLEFSDGKIGFSYDGCLLKTVERFSKTGHLLYTHDYLSYDQNGRLLNETLPGGFTVEHVYDPAGRKTKTSSHFYEEACTYDLLGNRTFSARENQTYSYAYDPSGQLTGDEENSYAYDAHFNRLAKNGEEFSVNGFDELTVYSYDIGGNLCKNSSYRFDALNRLTHADGIEFQYDAFGRKTARSGSVKEKILFDEDNEFAVYDEKGTLVRLKVPGQLLLMERAAAAIELNGAAYAPLYDCAGNIVRLADLQSRSISHAYGYTAFGESLFEEEACFNPWRFAGKSLDPELGLYDFGKRLYDPSLGRWLSLDPIGFIDMINLYQYCRNNPYSYCDPDGQMFWCVAIPLLYFSAELTIPSLTAILTPIVYSTVTSAVVYGGYKLGEYLNHRLDKRYYDDGLPYNWDDLGYDLNSPNTLDGFKWHGEGTPSSGKGGWFNEETQESLHPDLDHGPPQGPHWDYKPRGNKGYRIYPDGSYEPKE